MSHTNETAAEEKEQDMERQETETLKSQEAEANHNESADLEGDGQQEGADNEADAFKKQAEENYQKLLRVQADYDNFRRRSRLEKEEFAKYASQKLIEQLLPVFDNFDRALAAGKDNKDPEAFMKGVDMIFRQFAAVFEGEGVKPIEAVGQPFNPEYHQAIMQVESEEHEEGIVVEEVQKGYMMKDKVIRPTMVKVSS